MIFLITRPFVWLAKLLKAIVTAPLKLFRGNRNRKTRKNAKVAAKAVKQQAKTPVP